MIKELQKKTNEQIGEIIVKLKLQLLESRFKFAVGEIEKTHKIKEIRKTIAQALTVLNSRKVDITFGKHGVTLYDRKNNTVKSITDQIAGIENIQESAKTNKKHETKKQVASKSETKTISKEKPAKKVTNVNKTQKIRKTAGGK